MRGEADFLVIGATGRIGRGVVNGLIRRGLRPRVLARDPARMVAIFGEGAEIVAGDLDDPASLRDAMAGVRSVYLASSVGAGLVAQHARAVDAARAAGAEHVVRISTEGVEASEPMALSEWHRRGEAQLEASGLAWTHLRPCNFMHNMLTFAPTVAERGQIRAPFGRGRMTLVDVDDIAAVAVACLLGAEHRRRAYKVTGDEWLGYDDVAAVIGDAVGRTVRYVPLSPDEARAEMRAAGSPPWLIEDLIRMYALLQRDGAAPVTDVVRAVAGRTPRRFDDFAREHAPAFASGEARH
ncbi:NAD(P)H-binding protein [Roseomonas sp. CCTCC AB2023176]|uniref:NAD(P)H-binding protein n=1 Tax=Roseomonas sp. CCTCC AB2023176 TaxID=3342640 RepID=UPI0035E04CD5